MEQLNSNEKGIVTLRRAKGRGDIRMWTKIMFCVAIISSLHGVGTPDDGQIELGLALKSFESESTNTWNGRSDHLEKALKTKSDRGGVFGDITAQANLEVPDKKYCFVAGLAALGFCYRFIPWIVIGMRSYEDSGDIGGR